MGRGDHPPLSFRSALANQQIHSFLKATNGRRTLKKETSMVFLSYRLFDQSKEEMLGDLKIAIESARKLRKAQRIPSGESAFVFIAIRDAATDKELMDAEQFNKLSD
jgi:hypothetical protein